MSSTTPADFKVLGTRPIRHDGFDKVTGKARYGADYNFAEMLYGKVLRSPHAHANIKSIHVDKALRLPGVKAVITGADFPTLENKSEPYGEYEYNPSYMARNIMARGKALYDGHAVAAVAAIDPHIAQEALDLIEVEYEPLPAVLDVRKAMEPDAPILLPDLSNSEMPGKPTNVASHMQFSRGNLAAGFAAADFVVEREFTTAMVHQGYVEPHNAVAVYHTDGCATVYSSSQSPVDIRTMSARVSGVPVDKVVPAEIGGGFGGKLSPILEPVAVLLSQRTGHPVKMVMSRNEEFRATGPTSGTYIKVKMGATREGKLTAAEIWMAFEAGALPGSPVGGGMITAITSYAIENFQLDGYDVVVNRPKTGAYRAPGATMAAFAVESVVDELARKCETDPLEFRIRNGVKEGSVQVIGIPFKRIGFIEVCEAIKNSDHYRTPLAGPNRGRGVAVGFWINGGMSSSAAVNIHSNGTVSVVTGSVDIGGTRAVSAMIAAEVLGVPAEEVRPMVADTDSIAHTDMTGGSRTAFATGWAVLLASQDALAELKRRAAKLLQIDPAEVAFEGGKFFAINNGKAPLTLRELAAKFPHTGGPVSGKASLNATPGVGPTFAGCCVDVEVDPDTGKVQILRCTVAQDAGKALHPSYVEGQMQGGTAQGLGWAFNEEYIYDDRGVLRNPGFLDYRMPTCLDLPMIETIVVEVPNPGHPLGVRGVGEVSIVPPPAAAANAIFAATGIRMTELPMSPPRLLKAMTAK